MTSHEQPGDMTAAEFMAQLASDDEYQKERAEWEAQLQSRVHEWRHAERPIVEHLASAGVGVESVWDLVNTSEPYPTALPILVEHLERGGYPDRVLEGLGRALGVKPAVEFWDRIRAIYLNAKGPDEEEGAAVALAACATRGKSTI